MKKIIFIIIPLCLLQACGSKTNEQNSNINSFVIGDCKTQTMQVKASCSTKGQSKTWFQSLQGTFTLKKKTTYESLNLSNTTTYLGCVYVANSWESVYLENGITTKITGAEALWTFIYGKESADFQKKSGGIFPGAEIDLAYKKGIFSDTLAGIVLYTGYGQIVTLNDGATFARTNLNEIWPLNPKNSESISLGLNCSVEIK